MSILHLVCSGPLRFQGQSFTGCQATSWGDNPAKKKKKEKDAFLEWISYELFEQVKSLTWTVFGLPTSCPDNLYGDAPILSVTQLTSERLSLENRQRGAEAVFFFWSFVCFCLWQEGPAGRWAGGATLGLCVVTFIDSAESSWQGGPKAVWCNCYQQMGAILALLKTADHHTASICFFKCIIVVG